MRRGYRGRAAPAGAGAVLYPRDPRYGRQRGSARGQMQKISAGKFHFERPSRYRLLDHLVGEREHAGRQIEAERLGGVQIDHQFILGRVLYRKAVELALIRRT